MWYLYQQISQPEIILSTLNQMTSFCPSPVHRVHVRQMEYCMILNDYLQAMVKVLISFVVKTTETL